MDKPDLGIVLDVDGAVCGFIGAIYSRRDIRGATVRCCNLTSIAVDDKHRGHTLKMFAALFADKDVSFTCFSASEEVAKILDFFKFKHRASERIVATPLSGLTGAWSAHRVEVVTSPRALDAALTTDELTIARDHRAYRCGQLLLVSGQRRCFVVTIRRGRGARAFADVLHASDPELLMTHLSRVHGPLFRAHRTLLTGIDRAWVAHQPAASFVYRNLRPVYLRSSALQLDEVDALYSELVPMYG
ncbi:MAG TPA: hypothetical protein VH914_17245 [Acidimicrobiia bacterium]|nr:hypothetical protein [Acidimicrobiia bacterium]